MRLRPGLRPRLLWGSLQRSSDLVTEFKGAVSLRAGEGRVEKEGSSRRREKEREGRGGREREVREKKRKGWIAKCGRPCARLTYIILPVILQIFISPYNGRQKRKI